LSYTIQKIPHNYKDPVSGYCFIGVNLTGSAQLSHHADKFLFNPELTDQEKASFAGTDSAFWAVKTAVKRLLPRRMVVIDIDLNHSDEDDTSFILRAASQLPTPNRFCFSKRGGLHLYYDLDYKLPLNLSKTCFLSTRIELLTGTVLAGVYDTSGFKIVVEVQDFVKRFASDIIFDKAEPYAIYEISHEKTLSQRDLQYYFSKDLCKDFSKLKPVDTREEWVKLLFKFKETGEHLKKPFLDWTDAGDREDHRETNTKQWDSHIPDPAKMPGNRGNQSPTFIDRDHIKDGVTFVNHAGKGSLCDTFDININENVLQEFVNKVIIIDNGAAGVSYIYHDKRDNKIIETPVNNPLKMFGDTTIYAGQKKYEFFNFAKSFQKVYTKRGIVFDGQEDINTYNILPPSIYTPKIDDIRAAKKLWGKFQDFVMHLSGDHEEGYLWLHRWLTICIVGLRRGVKPRTAVSLVGKSGTGKSTLASIITEFTGGKNFTGNITANRVTKDNYTMYLRDKLFLSCEEAEFKDDSLLKEWITGEYIETTGKWKEDQQTRASFAMLFAANNYKGIYLDNTNRRIAVFAPTDRYQCQGKSDLEISSIRAFFSSLIKETAGDSFVDTMNTLLYFYTRDYENNRDEYLEYITTRIPETRAYCMALYEWQSEVYKEVAFACGLGEKMRTQQDTIISYSTLKDYVLMNRRIKERDLISFLIIQGFLQFSPMHGQDPEILIPSGF
jgi:adenylate kinase family enzyme